MTVDIHRADDRFKTNIGWLDSKHSFSFSRHWDEHNTHHGLLLVNNDDIVLPGTGFETHPHRDMEIVTWVLQGSLVHQDSTGHSGVIYPGLAQRMSAGTGILHSEKNDAWLLQHRPEHRDPVHFVQMWVVPDERGIDPGYEQLEIGDELLRGGLVPVASGMDQHRDVAAIRIRNRDAALHAARLDAGASVTLPDAPFLHLFVARGVVDLEGSGPLAQGDAVRFTATGGQRVTAVEPAEILVWQMHAELAASARPRLSSHPAAWCRLAGMYPGDKDVARAAAGLAARVPAPLAALAHLAYNYSWSWLDDGASVFAAVDPDRWGFVGHNPVRLLTGASPQRLAAAAENTDLHERIDHVAALVDRDLNRPFLGGSFSPERPVAFFSAEFGVHRSLPVYSGGLGVLAGDIVKEASDLAVPLVGIGLLYRTGYFHQRLDTSGRQHEYWIEVDPATLPCVLLRDDAGEPITVTLPISNEDVAIRVWRVNVGRVPLYLLDTDIPGNSVVARWITSRLYEGNRAIRLAQYAVLGAGAVRILDALGIEPGLFHLNEGHPALAAVELAATSRHAGVSREDAWASVRQRIVFTTHTPVAAGNETYSGEELHSVLGRLAAESGSAEDVFAAGRVRPDDVNEPSGMTVLALRASRSANAVSELHGEVARAMWQPLYPEREAQDVPITHVTNGAHVPTWLQPPMRQVLDRYLGENWIRHADDAAVWAGVDNIPDDELWEARNAARRTLVDLVQLRATRDRLRRGEDIAYVNAAERGFDPDRLTVGFARRVATYKRLYLLSLRAERAIALLGGNTPLQFVFAGKAHPLDEGAKQIVHDLFQLNASPDVPHRVVFLEDYDLGMAGEVVAGCDVWLNVPRPPLEASGTSGMKACFNGGLNLSVLDGWWAEAYDRTNGWAIDGTVDPDEVGQDHRHADALFDLMQHDVVPMFHDRDQAGIPRRWLQMVRASLKTNGPRFSATRMVRDYVERIYQ